MRSQIILASLRSGTTLLWLIALVVLGLLVQPALRTEAQDPFQDEIVIESTGCLTIELQNGGVPLPLDEILALLVTGFTPPGILSDRAPARFRPTMGEAEYKAAKAVAPTTDATVGLGDLQDLEVGAPSVSDLFQLLVAPEPTDVNFPGMEQDEFSTEVVPPDPHGAVGKDHFCQVVNRRIACYDKESPNDPVLPPLSLDPLFAARVVYDSIWSRWVIYAQRELVPDGAMQRWIYIFVSKTSDPTGEFFYYRANVNIEENDDIWDYGQVGMDQDAVIFTGNVFGPDGEFRGARMFAVAKARLYNGLGSLTECDIPVFDSLEGTLAPPIVLDQNGKSFLVAARPQSNVITKYTLTNSSRPGSTELTMSTIPVDFYLTPPGATQPNTTGTLETLDARFINASTQVGNSLFQVHTVSDTTLPGFRVMLPTPRWYEFDTEENTVIKSGPITASAISSDWMASITANVNKDLFVVWSSTEVDPTGGGLNAQVRFTGLNYDELADDLDIGPGLELVTSESDYWLHPWGRYSAATVDPEDSNCAWIVGETIINPWTWGTQIGKICFD